MTNSSTITSPDPDLVISRDEDVMYFISKIINPDVRKVIQDTLIDTEWLLKSIDPLTGFSKILRNAYNGIYADIMDMMKIYWPPGSGDMEHNSDKKSESQIKGHHESFIQHITTIRNEIRNVSKYGLRAPGHTNQNK